jgi:hypothetical protein
MLAFAGPNSAEIETQHHQACSAQAARQAINHLVVHGAAIKRMRMAHQGRHARCAIFGFFEQRFEAAGGARQKVALDAPRHVQLVR